MSHLAIVRYLNPSNFPLNGFSVSFRLIGRQFDHCDNKFRFSIFCHSHRAYRRSAVMVGSEDPLQKCYKCIFFQEGSSGTHFDHGQFEIKTFPIYTCPNTRTCTCSGSINQNWRKHMCLLVLPCSFLKIFSVSYNDRYM